MDDLKLQLENEGFKYWDRVIGKTGRDREGHRGNEIKEWLNSSTMVMSSFCVVDDEVVDICGARCRAIPERYVVQTDMNEGMSDNNVDRIIYTLEIRGMIITN